MNLYQSNNLGGSKIHPHQEEERPYLLWTIHDIPQGAPSQKETAITI